jgi:hypothetical protein
MVNGIPNWEGRFVEVGHGFLGILLGSWALRWTMPGMVLGDVASWHRLYLATRPSHVGGWCGWASLPFAPSYGMHSLVEGTELPIKHCLIPLCSSGRWHLSGGGVQSPRAWIFDKVLTVWVPMLPNLTWSKSFLPCDTYPMSESS